MLRKLWETYTTFTHGAMDKAQFLDVLIALGQEPDDLEETFRQANSSGTGALSYEEMMARMGAFSGFPAFPASVICRASIAIYLLFFSRLQHYNRVREFLPSPN